MRFLFAALLALGMIAPAAAAGIGDAQGFVNTASQAFRKGDYKTALDALRKAEPIVLEANDPSLAQIRFNIARCLQELGQNTEALKAYELYLKVPDSSARKSRAQLAIQSLKRKVYGGVAISCDPAGAMVTIKDVTTAPAACPLRKAELAPGDYKISVAFDGYETDERTVTVGVGEPVAVTVSLKRTGGGLVMPNMDPPADPVDPWPWIWTGGGALLVAGGVGLTVSAISARDDAEPLQPSSERDDLVKQYERNEALSFVAYGIGIAALTTGLVLLTADDDEPAKSASLRWTGNGVMLQW